MVLGESNVGLLLSSWSVEGVNLLNLELVESSACFLDHFLVGSFVHDKYKSVVVFDGLDGGLTTEWVLDSAQFVESVLLRDSSQCDLWCSVLMLNRWSSESGVSPDL